MAEQLSKLRPDRDLQCYFQQPSAIAALSDCSASGFTVSGCWRQQFDWAVVEWSRDNVFEHPSLRNLPDGDLRGLRLSYEETRDNCIPLDSTTYDAIGWSYLRIWEETGGKEYLHWVRLADYATPVEGETIPATAELHLDGVLTVGDQIELAWLDQNSSYVIASGDTAESALAALAQEVDGKNGIQATASGDRIKLTYLGAPGTNGNRVGVYGTVSGARTECWSPSWAMFSGGMSPSRWRIDLDFGNLIDKEMKPVNVSNVRRMRWTWAADVQFGSYERSEFAVTISNWQLSGGNAGYLVAGVGSRRIENNSGQVTYEPPWVEEQPGNYSGGSIHYATEANASVQCTYTHPSAHRLYLGTRYVDKGGKISCTVDGAEPIDVDLNRDLEDVLIRVPLGDLAGGLSHTVTLTHSGEDGQKVYFDFLEAAVPTADLPEHAAAPTTTLATDWDTYHSMSIAPERTAWLVNKLGFKGRANHYAGAMWFYELMQPDNRYANGTIEFATPQFGDVTQVTIAGTKIEHRNLAGDTAETVAKCFELLITAGTVAVWAKAEGTTLTLTARAMGVAGNGITIAAGTQLGGFAGTTSGPKLAGGEDGLWLTDLAAVPRINRAARDWSRSYFAALKRHGIDVTAAFSMELQHGDRSEAAGIAQRYLDKPCEVLTPAVQTNFGPESTAFWKQVYRDMATVMVEAGVAPYLQFGEVQWWYQADDQSMPFYDEYTKATFEAAYDKPMAIIPSQDAEPALFPDECAFLAELIGAFTREVTSYVRTRYPEARFEVLYPPDVNDTPLNRKINFPVAEWTAENLACLKTENFTFTGDRNLNKARESIRLAANSGFPPAQRSHLVGIGDVTTPWAKETRIAVSEAQESIVLWALDQFCLIGYKLPLARGARRGRMMGR